MTLEIRHLDITHRRQRAVVVVLHFLAVREGGVIG